MDDIPCVFTSVRPAWSNRSLLRLAEKISASGFFAHVWAASPGPPVSDLNCRPNQWKQFMWTHKGRTVGFPLIKRELCKRLREDLYNSVLGNADSGHAFAPFLNELWPKISDYSIEDLQHAVNGTIKKLEAVSVARGVEGASH